MPKSKPRGHRQSHSRMASSASVVKLAALTASYPQCMTQRIQLVQSSRTQGLKRPPEKRTPNGRRKPQGAVLQQAAGPASATLLPSRAPLRPGVKNPSSSTEDEWESSESGAVTPNPDSPPDPALSPRRAAPSSSSVRAMLQPSTSSDVRMMVTARQDEPSPATPKPAQNVLVFDTAISLLQNSPSSSLDVARQPRLPLPVLSSTAITPPLAQAPQDSPVPRRAPPQSAIFPAGPATTPLLPSRSDNLDDDALVRHRHSSSSHSQSLQPGTSSTSRPLSVHTIAAVPASRPHPLLRGMSLSGASVGPLLTSDPANQPSSPDSELSRPGASRSMSLSGGLFKGTPPSHIKDVTTLPATSTVTSLSTSPTASSTAETVKGIFARARDHSVTGSASAAVSSLANATKSPAAVVPLWQTTVTFRSSHQYRVDAGGAFDLLPSDVRARHSTVAKSHAPGIASFQRVVTQRRALASITRENNV